MLFGVVALARTTGELRVKGQRRIRGSRVDSHFTVGRRLPPFFFSSWLGEMGYGESKLSLTADGDLGNVPTGCYAPTKYQHGPLQKRNLSLDSTSIE